MAMWILSGTTRVSQHQKKHSPTHTHHGINLLSPSTTIHGILPIQSTCFTVFFHNLSPSFLWSTSWPGNTDRWMYKSVSACSTSCSDQVTYHLPGLRLQLSLVSAQSGVVVLRLRQLILHQVNFRRHYALPRQHVTMTTTNNVHEKCLAYSYKQADAKNIFVNKGFKLLKISVHRVFMQLILFNVPSKMTTFYTHTTEPFYGSVEFVRDNPGEPLFILKHK